MNQDKFALELSPPIPKLTARYIAYVLGQRNVEKIKAVTAENHYKVVTDKGTYHFENLGLDIGYTNELKM